MELAKQNPVQLVGAPAGLQGRFHIATRADLSAEGKWLSNNPEAAANWGANFANKITVKCP